MTEVEYVIANFEERLAAFKGKRIVLHGSRNYAEAIIENYSDSFTFIGFMTLDSIDSDWFHGLRLIKQEELAGLQVDVIILTERVKYAVEAFYSIRRVCKKNNIKVFNMYGVDEVRVHHEAESAVPFNLERVEKLCAPYDIISFEVMDTLFSSLLFTGKMVPRKLFYDLIAYLRKHNKIIKFSIRKSYPADVQTGVLRKFGFLLEEKEEIVYRIGEDLSFRKLEEANPGKKILYIGNGLANEFILPRYYGIDTLRFTGIHNSDLLQFENEKTEKSFSFNPNWKLEIEKQILEKSVISFDIFDTLIMRKTLYPQDVFYLIEKRASEIGYNIKNYVAARIRAEENQPFCDIDQIYSLLEDYFEWDEETTQKVKEIELDTEEEMLIPREEVVNLLSFAKRTGKRIVLTSDMYLPETILRKILLKKGISGYEKIFVSCEIKKAKNTGLYNEVLKLCDKPEKILHIGDNLMMDGSCSRALGLTAVIIPSALDIALSRGWSEVVQSSSNLMERCLVGLTISNLFCDPFQDSNTDINTSEIELKRFSNCVIGPLATGYLTWLVYQLREEVFDGVIFFARDGWLSYNIYRKSLEKLGFPRAVYFYANRRSAFLCCADSEDEIGGVLGMGNFCGVGINKIMKNIYQIPEEELLLRYDDEDDSDYIERHMELIRKKAEKSRKGYARYSKKCGLFSGKSYAVSDFIAAGSTQHYLSKFLPFSFKGYYFAKYVSSPINDIDKIEYYFPSAKSPLIKGYVAKLEPFITSTEPSQNCITEEGIPVFAEEYRSVQELQEVEQVLKTAEGYSLEFFTNFYESGQIISPSLIEKMYSIEDCNIQQQTVYDDWIGIQIKKREETRKGANDEQS